MAERILLLAQQMLKLCITSLVNSTVIDALVH